MIDGQGKVLEILLVEDNPNDEELTLRALTKRNLLNKVHVVRDGAEALDFLFATGNYIERNINQQPKVILLDLKLPKLDGIEVLREIKKHKITQKIPVVILTSSREDRDLKECYDLGANSYIVKPVDFNQFIDAVGALGFYWLLLNEAPH